MQATVGAGVGAVVMGADVGDADSKQSIVGTMHVLGKSEIFEGS